MCKNISVALLALFAKAHGIEAAVDNAIVGILVVRARIVEHMCKTRSVALLALLAKAHDIKAALENVIIDDYPVYIKAKILGRLCQFFALPPVPERIESVAPLKSRRFHVTSGILIHTQVVLRFPCR